MQLCDPHLDRLERLIKSRGLWDLVPHTAAEIRAHRKFYENARSTARQVTLATFDPIAFSVGLIMRHATDCHRFLLAKGYDPDPIACPACFLTDDCPEFLPLVAGCVADFASSLRRRPLSPSSPSQLNPKRRKKTYDQENQNRSHRYHLARGHGGRRCRRRPPQA